MWAYGVGMRPLHSGMGWGEVVEKKGHSTQSRLTLVIYGSAPCVIYGL